MYTHAAGDDYLTSSTVVTFTAGDGPGERRSVFIEIIDDQLVEQTETFGVAGSVAAEGAIEFQGNASVNINDPDGMLLMHCLYTYLGHQLFVTNSVGAGNYFIFQCYLPTCARAMHVCGRDIHVLFLVKILPRNHFSNFKGFNCSQFILLLSSL